MAPRGSLASAATALALASVSHAAMHVPNARAIKFFMKSSDACAQCARVLAEISRGLED
jgi:hypothetical protein